MLVQDKTGNNEIAQDVVPTAKKDLIYCTFCSELASGYNSEGMPTCGVIIDHPNCNSEVEQPL